VILLGQSRLKNSISLIDNELQINTLLVICNVIEKKFTTKTDFYGSIQACPYSSGANQRKMAKSF